MVILMLINNNINSHSVGILEVLLVVIICRPSVCCCLVALEGAVANYIIGNVLGMQLIACTFSEL